MNKTQTNNILRGDLIEVFEIIKGYKKTSIKIFFSNISQSSFRGHLLKLNKNRVRLDIAKFFFGNRVINEWNDD